MFRRASRALMLAFALAASTATGSACTITDCTDILVYGLTVTVVGGADGQTCLVDVVAQDGDYVEDLGCSADAQDCACNGAGERAGTYTVTVSNQGAVLDVETVTVTENECHVSPEHLDVDVRGFL